MKGDKIKIIYNDMTKHHLIILYDESIDIDEKDRRIAMSEENLLKLTTKLIDYTTELMAKRALTKEGK